MIKNLVTDLEPLKGQITERVCMYKVDMGAVKVPTFDSKTQAEADKIGQWLADGSVGDDQILRAAWLGYPPAIALKTVEVQPSYNQQGSSALSIIVRTRSAVTLDSRFDWISQRIASWGLLFVEFAHLALLRILVSVRDPKAKSHQLLLQGIRLQEQAILLPADSFYQVAGRLKVTMEVTAEKALDRSDSYIRNKHKKCQNRATYFALIAGASIAESLMTRDIDTIAALLGFALRFTVQSLAESRAQKPVTSGPQEVRLKKEAYIQVLEGVRRTITPILLARRFVPKRKSAKK